VCSSSTHFIIVCANNTLLKNKKKELKEKKCIKRHKSERLRLIFLSSTVYIVSNKIEKDIYFT
jgi:hypothetical protein